jgi:hypothetical protein
MARLQRDPEYRARREEKDRVRQGSIAVNQEAAAAIWWSLLPRASP